MFDVVVHMFVSTLSTSKVLAEIYFARNLFGAITHERITNEDRDLQNPPKFRIEMDRNGTMTELYRL